MRRRVFLQTVLGLGAFGGLLAPALAGGSLFRRKPAAKASVKWEQDLKKAARQAATDQRQVLVVFGAKWCTWCKKMEQGTLADPAIVKLIEKNFVPVHLDYDESEAVAQAWGVESLPCSVVVSPTGEVVAQRTGHVKTSEYQQFLREALESKAEIAPAGRKMVK